MWGINKAISFTEGGVTDLSRNIRGGVVTGTYLGRDPVDIVENEGIKEIASGPVPSPSSQGREETKVNENDGFSRKIEYGELAVEETKRVSKPIWDMKVAGIIGWYCNTKDSLPYDAVTTLHAYSTHTSLRHVLNFRNALNRSQSVRNLWNSKAVVILTPINVPITSSM